MKVLALYAVALALLGMGCAQQSIGGDKDAHGCLIAAGYSWCDVTQKCIRAWEEPCQGKLAPNQALDIAKNSECTALGTLGGDVTYNNYTKTWWIDLVPKEPKSGCNPACVVWESNNSAEVNWRCTGLIPS